MAAEREGKCETAFDEAAAGEGATSRLRQEIAQRAAVERRFRESAEREVV